MRHFDRDRERTLAAFAEALLGVDAGALDAGSSRATLNELDAGAWRAAVDAQCDRLAAGDRRRLRALLTFLQLSPLLYLSGRNFTGLDRAARSRHLTRLATSNVGLFRRAFAVAKTVVTYAWYGRPEAWPAIGYDGPWLDRVAIQPLPDPNLGERAP